MPKTVVDQPAIRTKYVVPAVKLTLEIWESPAVTPQKSSSQAPAIWLAVVPGQAVWTLRAVSQLGVPEQRLKKKAPLEAGEKDNHTSRPAPDWQLEEPSLVLAAAEPVLLPKEATDAFVQRSFAGGGGWGQGLGVQVVAPAVQTLGETQRLCIVMVQPPVVGLQHEPEGGQGLGVQTVLSPW